MTPAAATATTLPDGGPVTTAATRIALPPLGRGRSLQEWPRSYLAMLRWEIHSLRLLLPILIMIQVLFGAGTIVGLGFFFDQIPALQALYISTGAAVVALILVGLLMTPQTISQHKMQGTYEYIWSLPVPRFATALAGLTIWMAVALPGLVLALFIATLRYDIALNLSPMIVPAVLLVVLMSTLAGTTYAHAIPNPLVTNLISNVLIFVVLMFSPINFPADRFPQWLNDLHSVLPFEHAANVVRAGLTEGIVENVGLSYAILTAWVAVFGLVLTWVLSRRG